MDSIALPHLQSAGFRAYFPVLHSQGNTGAASRVYIRVRDLAGVTVPVHAAP